MTSCVYTLQCKLAPFLSCHEHCYHVIRDLYDTIVVECADGQHQGNTYSLFSRMISGSHNSVILMMPIGNTLTYCDSICSRAIRCIICNVSRIYSRIHFATESERISISIAEAHSFNLGAVPYLKTLSYCMITKFADCVEIRFAIPPE